MQLFMVESYSLYVNCHGTEHSGAFIQGVMTFVIKEEFVLHSYQFMVKIFLQPVNNVSEVNWLVRESAD